VPSAKIGTKLGLRSGCHAFAALAELDLSFHTEPAAKAWHPAQKEEERQTEAAWAARRSRLVEMLEAEFAAADDLLTRARKEIDPKAL